MSIWKSAALSLPDRARQLTVALLAVVLGVTAVVAAASLAGLVRAATTGVMAVLASDTVILPEGSLAAADAVPAPPPLTDEVVAEIAAIPGVAAADGVVRGPRLLPVSADGRVLDAALVPTLSGTGAGLEVVAGRAPTGAGEVALDEVTLRRSGHEIGQSILLARPGPGDPIRARITGATRTDGLVSVASFSLAGAREHFLGGAPGYNGALVTFEPEADADGIRDAIRGVIPAAYRGVDAGEIASAISFRLYPRLTVAEIVTWALLALAAAAAATIISAAVAGLVVRAHDTAGRLRRLGASRWQVRAPILAEAGAVAVIGSLLGLLAGEAVARRANEAGWNLGLPLGLDVPPLSAAARWICLAVGVGLALFAAQRHTATGAFLSPADVPETDEAPRFRFGDVTWTGIGLGLIGLALFVAIRVVPAMPAPLVWGAVGAAALVIGTLLASPALAAVPVAATGAALAAPTRGVSTLAARNVTRWPARFIKSTAALLLLSATLAALAVLGASAEASAERQGPEVLHADLVVTSTVPGGFSRTYAERLVKASGVAAVAAFGTATALLDDDPVPLLTADPDGLEGITSFAIVEGRGLRDVDEALVRAGSPLAGHVGRGDTVRLTINQQRAELRVVGVFEAGLDGPALLTKRETVTGRGTPDSDTLVAVRLERGASRTAALGEATALLRPNPLLRVQTPAEYATPFARAHAAVARASGALAAPAFAAATIGLAGTLYLAQDRRRRELRALQLVGLPYEWLLGMIAGEAVIAGTIGGLIGTGAGAVAAVGLLPGLSEYGFTTAAVPWGALLGPAAAGLLVGLASALPPMLVYAGRHTGERQRGAESAGPTADPQT